MHLKHIDIHKQFTEFEENQYKSAKKGHFGLKWAIFDPALGPPKKSLGIENGGMDMYPHAKN